MVRTTYVKGPATVIYDPAGINATFQSKGDVKVSWHEETFAIDSDLYSKIDERIKERTAEITFTPIGEWSALSTLWPLSNLNNFIGSDLFAPGGVSSDRILRISGRDGRKLDFNSAAVSKMPEITQSAVQTLIGQVTFTAIGVDDETWAQSNSLWTEGSLAFTAPAAPSIPTQAYSVVWGITAPWNALETASGVKTTFDLQLEPWGTDSNGISGMTIKGLAVSSRLQPRNVTLAQFLALKEGILQGPGAVRGRSISRGASQPDLVVTGTGVSLTVKKASLKNPGADWGSSTSRIPDLELVAVPILPTDPWFIVGTGT